MNKLLNGFPELHLLSATQSLFHFFYLIFYLPIFVFPVNSPTIHSLALLLCRLVNPVFEGDEFPPSRREVERENTDRTSGVQGNAHGPVREADRGDYHRGPNGRNDRRIDLEVSPEWVNLVGR